MTPADLPSPSDTPVYPAPAVAEDPAAVLTAIEHLPLAERAAGYVQAHDELLAELQGGDHER